MNTQSSAPPDTNTAEGIAANNAAVLEQTRQAHHEGVMRTTYRELSDTEKATMLEIKTVGAKLHSLIEGAGASREISIAKTKLEEAVMWAVKHVTR